MEEIIKIQQTKEGQNVVSAREIYDYLELNPTQWKRWAVRNIEKNPFASEGVDWVGLEIKSNEKGFCSPLSRAKNSNGAKDYAITMEFAKKLSMQARTERGERARNYFIAVEKVAMGQGMASLDGKKVVELENRLRRLETRAIQCEISEFTVHGYAAYCKKRIAITEASQLGKMATATCKEQGQPIGHVKDARFGLVNTYPEQILYQTFKEFFSKPRF
jgi:phage anti-repressor protein